jgi:DNA-binding NarL/FixJ family response regulator
MSAEDTIADQLGKIVRLLSLVVTKGLNQRDQIALLASAGFQPKQIAELIGTTANTVSVTLAQMKKQQAGRGSSRGAKRGEAT